MCCRESAVTSVIILETFDRQMNTTSARHGHASHQSNIPLSPLQNITLDTFGAKNAKLNGIFYLRDIADGDKLNEGIAKAKSASKKVVIVGGGYIGMEVSSMLTPHGLDSEFLLGPHCFKHLLWPGDGLLIQARVP